MERASKGLPQQGHPRWLVEIVIQALFTSVRVIPPEIEPSVDSEEWTHVAS